MSMQSSAQPRRLSFNGYYRKQNGKPDLFLTEVGQGTPGGEYQRRFWHPVAYLADLGKVPMRVRALGEDLVVFKDLSGRVGCLHLHCSHRNTSLEYGLIAERGLRCCYHGRLFDIDGQILEVPGEPHADRIRESTSQGAYPVHVFEGIVFIYMGPPERIPVFPVLDRMTLPGVRIVPGQKPQDWPCNWMQIKENALDPHHTATLHMIPQFRGAEKQFADEFGNSPTFIWTETPAGCMYLGVRRVGDNVWVRSSETYGANLHLINSIFESGKSRKPASAPFLSLWTLPVDDEHSITFYLSHLVENEIMPWEKRRELEMFGQTDERPYEERQWIPGDHDAMVSQGPINPHELETLGSQDRGISLFRRVLKRNIQAVQAGQDPAGFFLDESSIAPTYANDLVAPLSDLSGNPEDPEDQRRFAEQVAESYRAQPPMQRFRAAQSS